MCNKIPTCNPYIIQIKVGISSIRSYFITLIKIKLNLSLAKRVES